MSDDTHRPIEVQADNARRRFLARLSTGLGAVAAAALGVPVVGFLLAPLFKRTVGAWRPVGAISSFAVGETVRVTFVDPDPLPWSGAAGQSAAWLRRESDDQFIAFAVDCTHLGCPVRWLAEPKLFMCPCHGGVYYENGAVAAGPPPRALTRYPVRVSQGNVMIGAGALPITHG